MASTAKKDAFVVECVFLRVRGYRSVILTEEVTEWRIVTDEGIVSKLCAESEADDEAVKVRLAKHHAPCICEVEEFVLILTGEMSNRKGRTA